MPVYTPYPLGDIREAIEKEALRALDAALVRVQRAAPGLDVSGSLDDRAPIPALLEAARNSGLVVVGCRGLTEFAGLLLGSVSASITAHASCSVAVVRGSGPVRTDAPVVVGIDGSGGDDATLTAAFEEAVARKTGLLAVHAWSDMTLETAAGTVTGVWPTWDRLRQEAVNRVEATLDTWRAKYPSVWVSTHVIRDRPAVALLEAGQTAQLLVVGSHGRGGFAGMRLGSVARRLVHHADCPVLIVRHAMTAEE